MVETEDQEHAPDALSSNRMASFRVACQRSKIVDPSIIDDLGYAFLELETWHNAMHGFVTTLEDALTETALRPVDAWQAAMAVLAWLNHWHDHERPVRGWLECLLRQLEAVPGVPEALGFVEDEGEKDQ